VSFYINCGIHTDKIAETLGQKIVPMPKEYECLFQARIERIATASPKEFEVTVHTENGKKYLADLILPNLKQVMIEYAKFNSVGDLLDACLVRGVWPYDDFCRFMSKTGDLARFSTFFNHFLAGYVGDERFSDLEARLNGFLVEFGHAPLVFGEQH
jgi:hypothetical protein